LSTRILVTGASGFLGNALVAALAQAGHTVRAATRNPDVALFPKGVEVVAVPDFRETIDWAPLLANVGAVLHLAGIAHVGLDVEPAIYDRLIHCVTAQLAAACAKANVRRLVFMSSVRAQSGACAQKVLRETDPPQPSESYGRAKLAAEGAVRSGGTPYTILRPVMVYGPGVRGNLAMLLRVLDTPWPLPLAALDNRRSLLSLDNLVAAVGCVLSSARTANETYLVADPSPVTLADILVSLRRGLGRPARLFAVPPTVLAAAFKALGQADAWDRLGGSLVVDPGKLRQAGWCPQCDTKAGLVHFAKSARAT
jgi:nucleoside-diphosphate-sugar epimerase